MLLVAAVVLLIVPGLVLLLVHAIPTTPVLLLTHSVLCVCVALFVGVAPSTLPMAFPAEARSTGVSITYNLAAIFFAGFVPAWLTWMIAHFSVYSPALMIGGCAVVTALCIPWLFRQIQQVEQIETSSQGL